ncbi:MAG: hypothetical protein ACI379_04340 [Nocardioides sp.]|uniref:hypothetical protein n=1 Tax=Nocardioides sp. TaxID=35761 RepID=UPI003EFDFACE
MSRRTASLAALAAGGLITAGLTVALPAQAATPGSGPGCPEAFPAANLVVGQTTATGLTTAGSYTRGGTEHLSTTTPEEFTGVYRGTVEDAYGDLFVFELEGSRITDENGDIDAGIWAGISGSPLYASDGTLIGSVSYTFGGYENTNYAGVTPAADIYALLDHPDAQQLPAKVALDAAERRDLTKAGVPAAAAAAGLKKLAPVSTLAGTRGLPERTQKRIAKQARVDLPMATAGTSAQDEEIEIVPGGSVAFAASYGTLPFYSVGTAVAVCDDVVLGYGHAGNFMPADYTMHGASTTIIQPNMGSSYKLANLGAPVGSQVHDGLNGVVGKLGALPASTEVVVNTQGIKTTSTTNHVSDAASLAYVTASQIARDTMLSVDSAGGGSASLDWTIEYTRAGGRTGTLTGSQKYSSQWYLSEFVYMDVASILDALVNNSYEEVQVTKVTVNSKVSTQVNSSALSKVEYKSGKKWVSSKNYRRVTLKPGKNVVARVTVAPSTYKSSSTKVVKTFTFPVAKNSTRAYLSAYGAAFGDEYYYFDEEMSGSSAESLDALLKQLAKVTPSDQVKLTFRANKGKAVKATWRTGSPTSGDVYNSIVFKK